MGWLSNIFRGWDAPQNRTAGSNYSFFMGGSVAGKSVTERSAMQMTAVYACVRILSEAVAGLPLHLYKYTDSGGKEKALDHPLYLLLHDEPNPEMSSFVFRETLMTHLLLWGNAYTLERIIRLDEELSGITERKQRVNSFYSKGLLDAAVYAEETDSILKREQELIAERESLTKDTEGGTERKKALASLLKYTQRGIMQTEYSEELLGEYVDHVIIYSRTEAGFVMKCGPEFRERME